MSERRLRRAAARCAPRAAAAARGRRAAAARRAAAPRRRRAELVTPRVRRPAPAEPPPSTPDRDRRAVDRDAALPPPSPSTLPLAADGTGEPGDESSRRRRRRLRGAAISPPPRSSTTLARQRAPKRAAPPWGSRACAIAQGRRPARLRAPRRATRAIVAARPICCARRSSSSPTFGPAFVELGRALLLLGDAAGAIDALQQGASSSCPTSPRRTRRSASRCSRPGTPTRRSASSRAPSISIPGARRATATSGRRS